MGKQDVFTIDRLIDIASGAAQTDPALEEGRGDRRFPYNGLVAFVQMTATGGYSIPTVLHCVNMGQRGLGVISRYMLHVGHKGAVLLRRSNGELIVLGATVVHCTYKGDMKHECGLALTSEPVGFSLEDFRDRQGNLPKLECKLAA